MRQRLLPLAFSTTIVIGSLLGLGGFASAHTGGPLDADGCHADHRTGSYHCHRGAAAGYTFPNREAMLEAVRTGKFPEKTVETESFFSKLWPWGKHHEQQTEAPAEPAPSGGSVPATGAAPEAGSAPAPALSAKEREVQEKLKVLQGLYEMGLITKEEYEGRRKAILDQI